MSQKDLVVTDFGFRPILLVTTRITRYLSTLYMKSTPSQTAQMMAVSLCPSQRLNVHSLALETQPWTGDPSLHHRWKVQGAPNLDKPQLEETSGT